ncbi:MAG: GNAT family N-acetyltransferase [Elainellaceae cyanobacterium]
MTLSYQDYQIRPWQPGDRQLVADLVRTVLGEYGMSFDPDHTDRDAVHIEDAYWNTGGEFWVIEWNGKLVGSGGFHPIERGEQSVELRKMFLLPEARGHGLGQFLLEQIEKAAIAKGFKHMWLETATVLTEAVRLYEKNGYRPPADNAKGCVARCDRLYVKVLAL